jgi:hypothetical protein
LIWERLAAAHAGLIDVHEFEQWVYSSNELEAVVGRDWHLELLGFDFTKPLRPLLERLFTALRPSWQNDLATYAAREFLDNRLDLRTAAHVLAPAHDAFKYIDSELDDIPPRTQYSLWSEEALVHKQPEWQRRLESFDKEAREAARELLRANS